MADNSLEAKIFTPEVADSVVIFMGSFMIGGVAGIFGAAANSHVPGLIGAICSDQFLNPGAHDGDMYVERKTVDRRFLVATAGTAVGYGLARGTYFLVNNAEKIYSCLKSTL